MMHRTPTPKRLLATALAGTFLLTACFDEASTGIDRGASTGAVIEGQVAGEVALAKRMSSTARALGGGLEGAVVTVARLKADGSLETVSTAEVKTDAKGRFSVESSVEAAHGLIVVARKDAKEFKAVVSGEVKKGGKALCRTLDLETTLEAEVYSKVQANAAGGKGSKVSFADIAAHVDGEVSVKAEGEGKAAVKDFLAAQLETEAETRAEMLVRAGKASQAQIEKAGELRLKAQAALEATLHAASKTEAGLTADVKAKAEGENVKAHFVAVAEAGIAVGEWAKAKEAAFRAMVTAHAAAEVEGEAKLAWLKSIALHNALSLEAALSEDVKATGGNVSIVADASSTLKLSLQGAKGVIEVDSAFAACRRSVAAGLKASLDGALGAGIALSETSQARAAFELSLKTATTVEAVADAYAKFYADAEAEIKASLGAASATLEASKLQAMVRAAALVNLQGGVQGAVGPAKPAGFSLSGSVEGNLAGADVKLATVKADGSLEIVSGVKAETGADGSFHIKTENPLPGNVVVVVTKDSSELVALVDAKTDSIKVGAETTVETQIYQKILQDGKVDITPADVKAQVDSGVAASLKGNDSLLASLVAALDVAAKVQGKFLTDSGVGLAQASLLLISTARVTAQSKLEADLKAAAGEAAKVQAAYEAYHGSIMDAYVKAGLDASAYARSMQVYAQAMVKASVALSMEAKIALIRSAHSQAARGLRSAMELQMKASGATEVIVKSAVEAGIALQAAIDVSSKVEAIEAAYASYHAAVTASLRGAFLLHADAISTVDGKIRGEGGARADLMAAVKADSATESLSKAHLDFAAEVESEVKGQFGGLGGPTAAQVKVMTQVLLLANMCGG